MRKLILLLVSILISVSLIVVFSFSGCVPAAEEPAAEEPAVGPEDVDMFVTIPTAASEWWIITAKMISSAVDAVNAEGRYNINLTLIHSDEPVDQVEAVNDYIIEKPDIVLMGPIDLDVSVTAVDACYEAGIPVVTIARESNSEHVKAGVVFNEPSFGEIQGEQIVELFPDGCNLVYIWGPRDASFSIEHIEQGLLPVFEEAGNINILHMYEDKQDTQDVGLRIAEDALVTFDNIDCISAVTDDMVLGAIQAAKAAGRFEEIKFVGASILPQGMCAILKGEMTASSLKSQALIAEKAVRLALKVYSGEEYEKKQTLEPVPITKENVETIKDAIWGGTIAEPDAFDFSQCG